MAETNTTVTETNKAENGSTGAYGGDPTQAVKGGANLPEKAVSTSEPEQTAKTFTQAELDAIVKQRLERQAKGHPSKEEMEAFRKWQDSRKTAEQLSQEKISAAENGRADAEKKLTLHNNDRISTAANTTPAEQYTRATVNGNMGTVRVHFYVDDVGAWQDLPIDYTSWHAGQKGKADAYGSAAGNMQTISIECIMNGSGDEKDCKARDNAARLAAYLLDTYGGDLYTHNYWCNVRNEKKGSIEALNKLDDGYKNCPVYIRPKWDSFTELVKSYRKNNKKLFYVQVGAFSSRENTEAYLKTVKKDYPGAFIKVM